MKCDGDGGVGGDGGVDGDGDGGVDCDGVILFLHLGSKAGEWD